MLPQIPHDNLYKFMAIFGLVSLLATAAYWYKVGQSRVLLAFERSYETSEIAIDLQYLESELDYYRKIEKDESKAKLHFIQTMKSIDKKQNLLKKKQEEEEYLAGFSTMEGWLAIISAAISYIFMLAGFILWYLRLQRFLDKEVSENRKKPYKFPKIYRRK